MKISKSERKKNAQAFYDSTFCNRNCKRAAIVVHRTQSKTNPNVFRCQFWAVPNKFAGVEPVIIAESINEKLFDDFGDTVIGFDGDVPFIIEDYADELRDMLGRGKA